VEEPTSAADIAEKRRALADLLASGAVEQSELSLSDRQRRFWMLRLFDPDVPTHVTAAYEIRGDLDVDHLQQALAGEVGRNDLLRSRFVEVDGTPLRLPAAGGELVVEVTDLPAPGDEHDRRLAAVARDTACTPFAVDGSPLLRAHLLRRGPGDHVLVLTVHQLVGDQTTLELIAGRALGADHRSPAPTGESYGSYSAAEREWSASGEADEELAWWKEELAGCSVLRLPVDGSRSGYKVGALGGERCRASVPAELAERLERASNGHLDAALLAGLVLVLGRYAGQADLTVGVPIDGRGTRWSGVPGPIDNLVVVRADLSGDGTLAGLVDQVRTKLAAATSHGRVPFERLVTELEARRMIAGCCWCSVGRHLRGAYAFIVDR
jgi:hypothetical protein